MSVAGEADEGACGGIDVETGEPCVGAGDREAAFDPYAEMREAIEATEFFDAEDPVRPFGAVRHGRLASLAAKVGLRGASRRARG